MIAFKNDYNIDEYYSAHPMLRKIIKFLHANWPTDYMVITRIFNPPVPGESGVHRTTPHRAADVRTHDLSEDEGKRLEGVVNTAFIYGDGQHPVALQHGDGPDRHLHLQVRNETHSRGD